MGAISASTWIRAGIQPGLPRSSTGPTSDCLPTGRAPLSRPSGGVLSRAKDGQVVEVGCLGGLGRTGTVLACMAVLGGVEPLDAVAWVRENYRSGAIETPEQESWVDWFAESSP